MIVDISEAKLWDLKSVTNYEEKDENKKTLEFELADCFKAIIWRDKTKQNNNKKK